MGAPKSTTQDCLALDVRLLKKAGALEYEAVTPWAWFSNGEMVAARLIFVDEYGVQVRGIEDLLERPGGPLPRWLTTTGTPCHLGGERLWWQCDHCDRRAAILYETDGWWACRLCQSLVYRCQRERRVNRAHRRANKIRTRLDWRVGIAHPGSGRPKGMHRRTYERLVERHDRYPDIARAELMAWWSRHRAAQRRDGFAR